MGDFGSGKSSRFDSPTNKAAATDTEPKTSGAGTDLRRADPIRGERSAAVGQIHRSLAAWGQADISPQEARGADAIARMPKWDGKNDEGGLEDRGAKGKGFRGGPKKDRDRWYGFDDKDFQKWYEREKQKDKSQTDLPDRGAVEAAHAEWVSLGKPKVNK